MLQFLLTQIGKLKSSVASISTKTSGLYYAEYTAETGTAIKAAFLAALQSVTANTGITIIKFAITDGESGVIIYNYETRRAMMQCGQIYDGVINGDRTALAAFRKYTYTNDL